MPAPLLHVAKIATLHLVRLESFVQAAFYLPCTLSPSSICDSLRKKEGLGSEIACAPFFETSFFAQSKMILIDRHERLEGRKKGTAAEADSSVHINSLESALVSCIPAAQKV
jgi:hypothetical protein